MSHSDNYLVSKTIRSLSSDAKIIIVTGDVSTKTKNELETWGIKSIVYKLFSITNIQNAIKLELGID